MPCLISARLSRSFIPVCSPVALLRVAHRHACRRLRRNDQDDCVIEFTETMLLHRRKELARRQRRPHFDAWLDRCARNHVEDFCRRQARRDRRETAWPEQADETGTIAPWEPAGQDASCESVTLREECGKRFLQAVEGLAPIPRDLFQRHYLHDETLTELANATGKTPDAIRMTLARACKQVRARLEKNQMTEADADEYLAAMRRGGGELKAVCAPPCSHR